MRNLRKDEISIPLLEEGHMGLAARILPEKLEWYRTTQSFDWNTILGIDPEEAVAAKAAQQRAKKRAKEQRRRDNKRQMSSQRSIW